MKSMEWLKLHTELRTDPALQALTDAQHRVWFNLLCFASDRPTRGVIANVSMVRLAIEVAKGNVTVLTKTLERLQYVEIISVDADGSITFCDFAERQYVKPSDQPDATAERKRRSRAAAQPPPTSLTLVNCEPPTVSRDVTPCHALETESETETEKEIDKEQEQQQESDKTTDTCAHSVSDEDVVVPDVVSSLRECGVTDLVIHHLVNEFPPDRIQQQVTWLPGRHPTQNPAGMLRRSIEEHWRPPCVTDSGTPSPPQLRKTTGPKKADWFAAKFPEVPRSRREICEDYWLLLSPDVQSTLDADARARFAQKQSALAPRLHDPNPGRAVRTLLTHYRHELMIERGLVGGLENPAAPSRGN